MDDSVELPSATKKQKIEDRGSLRKWSGVDYYSIRESVDSLCRDGADAQYMQYLR